MKQKLLLSLAAFFLVSCSLQEMRQDDVPQNKRAFSMEQAKEFFENDYTERLTKTEDGTDETGRFRGKLHPGEYTPLWDKAVYSESEGVAAYDVDIIADRSMVAIRAEFGPAGAKAERLKVYQKLVVRRNVGSGKMTAYIMSLIPDVGCEDNRIPEKFRSREKNKGGFNGIAVFATTDSGEIVRVQEYRDGKLMRGVYLPNGKGTYIDRCRKAAEILRGTAIMSKRNVMTRAGEDVWDDTWDDDDYSGLDINDLEDLGDGIYTDGYGNYYLDIDLDGDIDLETIAPSYAEGEEGEQEKEEDPWPGGTGDDDGGGSDDGGDDWPEDVPTDGEGNGNVNESLPSPDINIFHVGQHFVGYAAAGKNCLQCCKNMMSKMGQTNYGSSANVIYLVRENNTHTELTHYGGNASENYTKTVDCINRHLDAGRSIVAGINHTLHRDINDGTIDHFVLIVGREFNEVTGHYEYLYIETGTNLNTIGHNTNNRLVYNESVGMYIDDTARCGSVKNGPNIYTLTELRPNDGNTSGTIVQPAKRHFRFLNFIRQ